jgi:low affinity Fe/Cu permease
MPPSTADRRSLFDKFAGSIADFASRGVFFSACLLLVVLWAPSYFLLHSLNTWQLIINTITTIITFLLVALLENSQRRGEQALHEKLNAMAEGLADLMDHIAGDRDRELQRDVDELRKSVGLEQRT